MTVGVSASVAMFLSRHLVRRDAEVASDLVTTLLARTIPASYFTEFPPPNRIAHEQTLAQIAAAADTVRVKVYDRQGTILWSDEAPLIGRRFPSNRPLRAALQGEVQAEIISPRSEEHQGALRSFDRLEEIYLPVRYSKDGPILGVLEIYRQPQALFAALDRGVALVWILDGGGGLLLYLSLFGIVRKSSRTQDALKTELATYARTLEERVAERTRGLRKLHEQMLRSERLAATGLLAAGVAHEVGNPLACISSLAQVLLARSSDPTFQRGLQDIQTHTGRIQKIIQDLTQLTRPAPFQFRESSLNEIIQNAVALARHNPAARKMTISTALDPVLPPVHGAPDQLLQVFLNLILNAGDAGGDLTIQSMADGSRVKIIFSDTGRGMSPDELRRLFDPFYSTKNGDKHMGLGLFVSHEIVRQHGGTLQAESQLGQGSTFTVSLPVER